MSHSHRAKAIIGAIQLVPAQIYIRVDRRVRAPDSAAVNVSIRNAIQEETYFVIIFLGLEAMKPKWVRREYEWAREREKFLTNNS